MEDWVKDGPYSTSSLLYWEESYLIYHELLGISTLQLWEVIVSLKKPYFVEADRDNDNIWGRSKKFIMEVKGRRISDPNKPRKES